MNEVKQWKDHGAVLHQNTVSDGCRCVDTVKAKGPNFVYMLFCGQSLKAITMQQS